MQYLSGVPQYSSHLKWISFFLEVCAGVLWIDTMSVCSASIKETLQLLPEGGMCQLEYAYCSRIICTSSLSLGRWFITMLQRISAERLS